MKIYKELIAKEKNQLPLLLKKLNLRGEGIEIGVRTGDYSEKILDKSNLCRLYSIDPWIKFKSKEYDDISNFDQKQHNSNYLKTIMKLMRFKTRSVCLRMTSKDASKLFKNKSLDFIYIDAVHSYNGCKQDIDLWWPKLKKRGIFSGHDYLNGKLPEGNFGVKKAVDKFVKKNNLRLFITKEKWPTWYLIK